MKLSVRVSAGNIIVRKMFANDVLCKLSNFLALETGFDGDR
jgi:hypothetical protein